MCETHLTNLMVARGCNSLSGMVHPLPDRDAGSTSEFKYTLGLVGLAVGAHVFVASGLADLVLHLSAQLLGGGHYFLLVLGRSFILDGPQP